MFEQGSKAQLEEVWEKEDHFDPENFDPKTFFYKHGNVLNVIYVDFPINVVGLYLNCGFFLAK